uniref:Uncharacterized protein n=1 Tax=Anopheles coluzzii TaxID=1518534 RepID=A0A8W7PX13_ANOCL
MLRYDPMLPESTDTPPPPPHCSSTRILSRFSASTGRPGPSPPYPTSGLRRSFGSRSSYADRSLGLALLAVVVVSGLRGGTGTVPPPSNDPTRFSPRYFRRRLFDSFFGFCTEAYTFSGPPCTGSSDCRLTLADGSRVYGDGWRLLPLSPVFSAFNSSLIVPGITSACVDSSLKTSPMCFRLPRASRNSPTHSTKSSRAATHDTTTRLGFWPINAITLPLPFCVDGINGVACGSFRYAATGAQVPVGTCSISSCDISFMSSAAVVASTGRPPTNTE